MPLLGLKNNNDGEHWIIIDSYGNYVYDYEIYPRTSNYVVKFIFLWSCHQGEVIGGLYSSGRAYGMPFAWLHTNELSED